MPTNSSDLAGEKKVKTVSKDEVKAYMAELAAQVNAAVEEYLNDSTSPRYMEKLLGRSGYKFDMDAIREAIVKPANYLLSTGGNRWRPVIMLTIIEALGGNSKELIEFSIVPEIVHNAILIHDDIEDNSDKRRGFDSVHKKFGVPLALNLGDIMYFFPIMAVLNSKKLQPDMKTNFIEVYQRSMLKTGIGQAMDLAWGEGIIDPSAITESYYLQMVQYKSGALLEMAGELGAVLTESSNKVINALGRFCANLGIAFQIIDDIQNLKPSGIADKKGGMGEDITNGKATLITIHTLDKADKVDKDRLIEILGMHTDDHKLIDEAIGIMEKYNAFEYAEATAQKVAESAWKDAEPLLPPSIAKERLKAMVGLVLNRTS